MQYLEGPGFSVTPCFRSGTSKLDELFEFSFEFSVEVADEEGSLGLLIFGAADPGWV